MAGSYAAARRLRVVRKLTELPAIIGVITGIVGFWTMLYYQARGMRSYPWSRQERLGLVKFVVYCLLVVPLLAQSLIGYRKNPDTAWALHAPACLITFFVYSWGFIEGAIRPREQKRTRWSQ